MSFMPFLNQFIFPTMVSLYLSFFSFFPIHPISTQKTHINLYKPTHVGIKKTLQENSIHPSSTPEEQTASPSPKDSSTVGLLSPTPTPQEVITTIPQPSTEALTKAQSTINMSGKTVHLSMTYNSAGGSLVGSITGDCEGILSGNYDGSTNGSFTGGGNATCPMGFISVPVVIHFTGKLLSSNQASIAYDISLLGQTKAGSTILSLTE